MKTNLLLVSPVEEGELKMKIPLGQQETHQDVLSQFRCDIQSYDINKELVTVPGNEDYYM